MCPSGHIHSSGKTTAISQCVRRSIDTIYGSWSGNTISPLRMAQKKKMARNGSGGRKEEAGKVKKEWESCLCLYLGVGKIDLEYVPVIRGLVCLLPLWAIGNTWSPGQAVIEYLLFVTTITTTNQRILLRKKHCQIPQGSNHHYFGTLMEAAVVP